MLTFRREQKPPEDAASDGSRRWITVPVITCDNCGAEITDAGRAVVVCKTEGPWGKPKTGVPYFLHRACLGEFTQGAPIRQEESWLSDDEIHWAWREEPEAGRSQFSMWDMQEWFRLLENNVRAGSTVR